MMPKTISILSPIGLAFAVFATPAVAEEPSWKESVLEQNSAFYEAFRGGDLPAMEEVWGSREPIILDHPQGDLFDGRKAVMDYWGWALPGSSPDISCHVTGVARSGPTVTVYCDEYLFQGTLQMKNIFHMENGKWKMIYHGPPQQQGLS